MMAAILHVEECKACEDYMNEAATKECVGRTHEEIERASRRGIADVIAAMKDPEIQKMILDS